MVRSFIHLRWIFALCLLLMVGSALAEQAPDELLSALWSPNGEMIATGSTQGHINIWSKDLTLIYSETLPKALAHFSWSADSTRIAFAAPDNMIDVVNVSTTTGYELGERLASFEQPGLNLIKWSPSGSIIATSEVWMGYKVQFWDASSETQVANRYSLMSEENLSAQSALEWSPDGHFLASANEGRILIKDMENVSERIIEVEGTRALAWSPDSRYLVVNQISFVANPTSSTIIYDLSADQIKPISTFTGVSALESSVLSWSSDGKRIASGVKEGNTYKIVVFSAYDGSVITTYDTHKTHALGDFNWSPDGRNLVYVGRVDDPESPPIVLVPKWPNQVLVTPAVAFSPDDSLVAQAGLTVFADRSYIDFIRIWDRASNEMVLELNRQHEGHESRINVLDWSPDGRYLVSGGLSKNVIVWEIKNAEGEFTGEIVKCFPASDSSGEATWSPDGTKLAVRTGNLLVLDTTHDFALLGQVGSDMSGIKWSPDSTKIALGMQRGIAIYSSDLSTRYGNSPDKYTFLEPEGISILQATSMFDWSPDGKYLATLFNPAEVRIRDVETGRLVLDITGFPQGRGVHSIAWNPTGLRLAVSGQGWIEVWDLGRSDFGHTAWLSQHYETLSDTAYSVDWSSDGTQLVYGDTSLDSGIPTIVTPPPVNGNSTPNRLEWAFGEGQGFYPQEALALAWSPNGRYIAVGGSNGLMQITHTDGTPYITLIGYPSSVGILAVAWSPDSTRLITSATDNTLRIWQIDDSSAGIRGETLAILKDHFNFGLVRSLAWSPDGAWIAAITFGHNNLKIWDANTYTLAREAAIPNPLGLAWSPDSTQIALADTLGLLIRDAQTLQRDETRELFGAFSAVSVDWYGPYIVVAPREDIYSDDAILYVYDTRVTPPVLVQSLTTTLVRTVTFSPDGQLVAVQGRDRVEVWDWQNAELLASYPAEISSLTTGLAWSPDSTQIAYGNNGAVPAIFTVPSLKCTSAKGLC